MSRLAPGNKHKGRKWIRDYFYDHPIRDDNSHLYGALSSGKTKVACMLCFNAALQVLKSEDAAAHVSNPQMVLRSDETLRTLLWDSGTSLIIASHINNIRNHLINCELQTPDVRQAAMNDKTSSKSSPVRQKRRQIPTAVLQMGMDSDNPNLYPLSNIDPSLTSYAGPAGAGALISLNSPLMERLELEGPQPSHSSPLYNTYPLPQIAYSRSSSPFTTQPSSNHSSAGSRDSPPESLLLQPSDSISQVGLLSSSTIPRPPSHLGSLNRRSSHSVILPHMFQPQWTDIRRKRFEKRVMRLTASAGFALSWVEDLEWLALCEEFIPGAPQISRKVLTQRILRDVVAEFRQEVRKVAKGVEVTMQSDGWTGLNNHHLVAFMITMNSEKKVRTVEVVDTSKDRKTAENLLEEVDKVYAKLKDEYETVIVALVTDASGESRKARKLFAVKHPEMIIIDCYAHQINLVVGDFCKSKSPLLKYMEMAADLITWLRSKSRILSHLPLAVLRAVLTRWTAHYVAFRRLLHLYPSLKSLIYTDPTLPEQERVLVSGDAASKRKAREMVKIIENPVFWHSIALITHYLEPLAIAANITQGSFCRLDQVLLTFGYLVMTYRTEAMGHDPISRDAILNSIEGRWAKADQEVFFAAVLVNPFYRTTPFAPLPIINRAQINTLFNRLYNRFYQHSPSPEFTQHSYDFFAGKGFFSGIDNQIDYELRESGRLERQPDPLNVFNDFNIPGRPDTALSPFIVFARRLLSVSANSASCERLFSVFGNILTKLRNQTGNTVLTDLSEIKLHLRDEHIAGGSKQRLKKQMQANPERRSEARPIPQTVNQIIDGILQNSPINSASADTQPSASSREPGSDPSPPSSHSAEVRFSTLASQHVQSVEEDDAEEPLPFNTGPWTPIKISDLFDFSSSLWSSRYERFARISFEEELELYDLVDLDAEGEVDIDLHDSTQEIFMN